MLVYNALDGHLDLISCAIGHMRAEGDKPFEGTAADGKQTVLGLFRCREIVEVQHIRRLSIALQRHLQGGGIHLDAACVDEIAPRIALIGVALRIAHLPCAASLKGLDRLSAGRPQNGG